MGVMATALSALLFLQPCLSIELRKLTEINADCDLNCQNGGTCEILTVTQHHKNTIPQRCICQPGYGGLACENEVSVCYTILDEERYCQAGAPCVLDGAGNDICDCSQAYDLSAFAGLECEQSATEYCTDDGDMSTTAFCVNGGSCKTYTMQPNEKHPGCDCPDDLEGSHCEYLSGQTPLTAASSPSSDNSRGHRIFPGTLIGIFMLSLGTLVTLIFKWYDQKYGAISRISATHPHGIMG